MTLKELKQVQVVDGIMFQPTFDNNLKKRKVYKLYDGGLAIRSDDGFGIVMFKFTGKKRLEVLDLIAKKNLFDDYRLREDGSIQLMVQCGYERVDDFEGNLVEV